MVVEELERGGSRGGGDPGASGWAGMPIVRKRNERRTRGRERRIVDESRESHLPLICRNGGGHFLLFFMTSYR